MSEVLTRILADKKDEIASARRRLPLDDLKGQVDGGGPPLDFFAAVTHPEGRLRVIAEVKKASPSAGVIRDDFDPAEIALEYYRAGAAAISCLTDAKFFQGSLDDIGRIKQVVPLPVLRKDFIIEPYQIYESRAAHADAVLLIAECMDSDAQLEDLLHLAIELRLTTLLEVHDVESLLKVRPHLAGAHVRRTLLGINNRDLKTMTTDLDHTFGLLGMVDDKSILVSESGIQSPDDVARLCRGGVYRLLVGEHLMRQTDVRGALRELMSGEPRSD